MMNMYIKALLPFSLLLFFSKNGIAQKKEIIEKWKAAVVSIEGVTDSLTLYDVRSDLPTFDIYNFGTSIFLKKDNKRYLLTARHVLFDEIQSDHDYADRLERIEKEKDSLNKEFRQAGFSYDSVRIYRYIFKVPTLDEDIRGAKFSHLYGLGTGPYNYRSYTFSDSKLDLAVISFDESKPSHFSGKQFANQLENNGYIPVDVDDLDISSNLIEGKNVFAVGFSGTNSIIEGDERSKKTYVTNSGYYAYPELSFGRVEMFNEKLSYFVSYSTVYSLNSGAPLIDSSTGKLIGMLINPLTINKNEDEKNKVRLPSARVIPIKNILQIIEIQNRKDQSNR